LLFACSNTVETKLTFPAGHDPNDYEIGKRVGLETINIMNKDGSLNAAAGAACCQQYLLCCGVCTCDIASLVAYLHAGLHSAACKHCWKDKQEWITKCSSSCRMCRPCMRA
jgi:hypothetical protein